MALQKLANCIAELNRRMKASAMIELLLQDGVLSVPEYSQLNATIDRSGEIAGNRSLTCLLLGKSESEVSVFLSHLRELHPDLAELLEESQKLSRVCGQAETADTTLAGFLASSLHVASTCHTPQERDAELQALRAERDTIAAERDTLLTTVAEGTSTEYERAPPATQQSVRNLFRLRHIADLANYPRPLPKWRTVGIIPEDIRLCRPCVFQGHVYLSVTRHGSEQAILRNPLHDLNRPWSEIPLPHAPVGKTWERVRLVCSETTLYCHASTDYKSVPMMILEQRGDVWVLVTQLESVRRWAAFGIWDNSIVVAGGVSHNDTPCLEISMFPLSAEQSLRKWRQIGELDTLRKKPYILSQGKILHVVGGTGLFTDTLTSIVTLAPAPSSAQQPHSYTRSTFAVAAAPHWCVGAVMVRDRIVTAGGWQQHSPGSSTGDCSDQCSMWDDVTSAWLPLPPLSVKQNRPGLFFHDSCLYCVWGDTSEDGTTWSSHHTIDMLSV